MFSRSFTPSVALPIVFTYVSVYITTGSTLSPGCGRSVYHGTSGVRGSGAVIQELPSLSIRQCRRACRLYSECSGFNMPDSGQGTCQLITGDTYIRDTSPTWVYYRACPMNMTYNDVSESCVLLHIPVMTSEQAKDFCRGIHPESKLITTDTMEKLLEFGPLAVDNGITIWTSGYGDSVGGAATFYWNTTSAAINVTMWSVNKPSTLTDRNCVHLNKLTGLLANNGCDMERSVMCEL